MPSTAAPAKQTDARVPWMLTALHVAAIVLVTVVAFYPALGGEFVSDDLTAVRDNVLIRRLDGTSVRTIFRSFDGPNYMPFKVLSFAVDRRLWGPEPWGFHVTNLAIHVGAALLVYAVLRRLALGVWPACFAALLWAVHPLQVESVAWIAERKNVLSGFAFFAAFLLYLDWRRRPRLWVAIMMTIAYVVAILSKMTTVVLPAICLAYEVAYHRRIGRRAALATILLFTLAAVVVWYNLAGNPIHGGDRQGGSLTVSALSASVVVWRYLGLVFDPRGVRSAYDVTLYGSLLTPRVLGSVVGIVMFAAVAVVALRARHPAGFWLAWFAITLLPLLNVVVPFRSLMNDRHMYLAVLGPVALVALFVRLAAARPRLRLVVVTLAAVAVVGAAVLTSARCAVWASPVALWLDGTERREILAGDPIVRRPDWDALVAALEARLVGEPGSAIAHNNLGALLFEAGRFDEAGRHFEAARRWHPDDANVLQNLGRLYARSGRAAEGAALLERATDLEPYSFVAFWQLARLQLARGDDAGARRALEACARLMPKSFASSPWLRTERETLARLQSAAPTRP